MPCLERREASEPLAAVALSRDAGAYNMPKLHASLKQDALGRYAVNLPPKSSHGGIRIDRSRHGIHMYRSVQAENQHQGHRVSLKQAACCHP